MEHDKAIAGNGAAAAAKHARTDTKPEDALKQLRAAAQELHGSISDAAARHGGAMKTDLAAIPEQAMAIIESERISMIPGPPTLYASILDGPDRSGLDLSSLRLAVTATKLTPAVLEPGSQAHLTLRVRNTGTSDVPQVAVALRGLGTPTDPANTPGNKPLPSNPLGPNWLVDSGPGGSPLEGSNTWLGGPLAAGDAITLRWQLTAVRLGAHPVTYAVTGGLTAPQAHATVGTALIGTLPAKTVPSVLFAGSTS